MGILEVNVNADCAEFMAELHSLNAAVFRNFLFFQNLTSTLLGFLEDCNVKDFAASIDSWQPQFNQTKEAYDAYASKLKIFADKHGGGQQLEDVVQNLLENNAKMHQMMDQLCEEIELLKERFDSTCEKLAAVDGAVAKIEALFDDEDYGGGSGHWGQ
uniref:(northern house mosquito) hypothetical protein n=1 Tax=Culex pipiens TaxID=7175 RepID=A0A8D8DP00_CULPI